jgi:hypothetical protein
VRVRVTDAEGAPVAGARVTWSVKGRGASVVNAATTSGGNGEAAGEWILGTNAKELQELRVSAQDVSAQSQLVFQAVAIPRVISRLGVPLDSTRPLRVGDSLPLTVEAVDPYGNVFPAPNPVISVSDTTMGTVLGTRIVGGPRRGRTTVWIASAGVEASAPLHVTQFVANIIPDRDTVRISSIGVKLSVPYSVRDDRNRPVLDTAVSVSVDDSGVVHPLETAGPPLFDTTSVSLMAVSNGSTHVTLSVPGTAVSVPVIVAQVPETIMTALTPPKGILTLPIDAALPLSCAAADSNGAPVAEEPAVLASKNGTVTLGPCSQVRIVRSGVDTLSIGLGPVRQTLGVAIAVPPRTDYPLGQPLVFDSLMAGAYRWTPSARRNSGGAIELYLTQYPYPDSGGWPRGDLYRFVSSDGLHFHNDGMALPHGDDPCGPDGSGVENVVITPRSDGRGWRMYYAAGSWGCFGWQVYSATSTDERTWTKEPGVRLSNGGELYSPPTPPSQVPWPVGEGMVVDHLSDGRWRIITASFEHVLNPAPDSHWQISEWLSGDQLSWTYNGILLGTDAMPPAAQGSVYSPSIVEFAPGLYRMFFTGDNRRLSTTPQSELWSAVSTDEHQWQVEGEMIGAPGIDIYYATAVGDRLYFLTNVSGHWSPVPSVARVQMP